MKIYIKFHIYVKLHTWFKCNCNSLYSRPGYSSGPLLIWKIINKLKTFANLQLQLQKQRDGV